MIGIKAGFLFFFPVVYSLSVSVIGDSLLASSSPIVPTLEKRSGLTFQNHALVGAGILNGWVESIPSQYDKLRPLLSDKTIFFLDGGGNDVMSHRGDCQVFNEACQNMFSFASSRMNETFHLMAKDGIASVYYLGFYCLPSYGRVIDEGTLLLEKICREAPIPCYFADARDLTIPRGWDGLHPTSEGYDKLIELLWNLYRNNQPLR